MKKNCPFYTHYSKNTSFNIRYFLLFIAICFTVSCKTEITKETESPNIIVIMADDLGYSDLGCYGGEISTPSLDNMASEGIRLPNVFNAGMCVASRSAMLTGKWWPRAGFGAQNGPNIAQELKKEGYRTGLIGKWHLDGTPNEKGFDYFFGFLGGYSSYFKGGKDYRINEEKYEDFGNAFYSTDAFSESAVEFVKSDNAQNKAPFFLYLSYQSPHNPLQAPKEDIMKYRGSYLKGWQSVRKQRIEKQKALGLIADGVPLPDYPQNLPDWSTLTDAQMDLEDLRMSVYAAMVERMDKGIGQLIDALKATNQDKNTLILFLSDNGTDSFSVLDKILLKKGLLPGDVGSNYQLGTGWAYASVSPLRLYKISQHSGGVKTAAIVRWPESIENPNSINTEAINLVDFMPTFLEAAKSVSVSENNTFSGQSFLPMLKGESWKREAPMYFQFMDNRAMRTSEWSLIEVDGSGWELYNTIKDPLETNDVSNIYKDQVLELEKKWLNWWITESGESDYQPKSTEESPHYKPQGDRGTGVMYSPSAMPEKLSKKYSIKG
ncbi:arylsulfatase [Seonamhaeicola sediminis]|uniref:Arylsulfatase n=1 Tax=Seonamhaeicola sediminis TaxID=2528206 RepID=A0A562YF20_9FLAO|nr:arylsulfatase [Seonamhaeicola sediminis]TWO33239.1 arylsulfatase [Seonamhaeicola sediminis]